MTVPAPERDERIREQVRQLLRAIQPNVNPDRAMAENPESARLAAESIAAAEGGEEALAEAERQAASLFVKAVVRQSLLRRQSTS